mmetsp:Transcript_34713/g.92696  ORF Transcript_34713/g.92696 Transcript_34713/m.92696 type:complete len:214 (-) Transcript_34713:35-676(-)
MSVERAPHCNEKLCCASLETWIGNRPEPLPVTVVLLLDGSKEPARESSPITPATFSMLSASSFINTCNSSISFFCLWTSSVISDFTNCLKFANSISFSKPTGDLFCMSSVAANPLSHISRSVMRACSSWSCNCKTCICVPLAGADKASDGVCRCIVARFRETERSARPLSSTMIRLSTSVLSVRSHGHFSRAAKRSSILLKSRPKVQASTRCT